uniref:Uncharacterized protein n=1 Tax=viral metagenome TaxID=1070528 RepID=A0A6M3IUL8_9ZZZZ
MKLALLILILAHLAGPGLAEAPLDTEMVVVELEKEVKALKTELNRYKAWYASSSKKGLRIKPSDF